MYKEKESLQYMSASLLLKYLHSLSLNGKTVILYKTKLKYIYHYKIIVNSERSPSLLPEFSYVMF